MAEIAPVGKLTVYDPRGMCGLVTSFGFARDWRPGPDWAATIPVTYMRGLGALTVDGDVRPRAMPLTEWTAGCNAHFHTIEAMGSTRVAWQEYYDGSAYAAGTSAAIASGTLTSNAALGYNWVLHLIRHQPPPSQGVRTEVTVQQKGQKRDANGAWQDAVIILYLPFADDAYRAPLLYVISPTPAGAIDLASYVPVAQGDDWPTTQQGAFRESVGFEYLPHPSSDFGGFFAISNSNKPGERWIYHDEDVKAVAGIVTISVQGAVTGLNFCEMQFGGAAGYAVPQFAKSLPVCTGSQWNQTAVWDAIQTAASGWTVGLTAETETINSVPWYRPKVTFTRTDANQYNTRPVVWLVNETHSAQVGGEVTGTSVTEGEKALRSIRLTQNADWRGASARMEFNASPTEAFPTWKQCAPVDIELGWETGSSYASRLMATHFIAPGGLPRELGVQHGPGYSVMSLQTGDMAGVILPKAEIVDMGQAGGWTLHEWFEECALRLGLTSEYVYVDPAVADWVIWTGHVPSEEAYPAPDGMLWSQHFDEVCRGLGLRWGCDKAFSGTRYPLFIDQGIARYSGTPDYTISVSATAPNRVSRLTHEQNSDLYHNAFKISSGPRERRTVNYLAETLASRQATIGRDLWRGVDEHGCVDSAPGTLATAYLDYWSGYSRTIKWESTILRPDILPEQFVSITDVDSDGLRIGLTAGMVFQVREATHNLDAATLTGTSEFIGSIVYIPGNRRSAAFASTPLGN